MNRKVNIEELFLQYYRPLCLYALRLLSDLDRAEDVVQDSFVKILERPACISLLPERQVAAYLFRIVRNRCVDELRRDGQQTVLSLESPGHGELPVKQEDVDKAVVAARLWTAIDALPDRCREVFLMAKRDGMTYREIAEELGISERTVEHQVSKALRLLRSTGKDFFRLLLFL